MHPFERLEAWQLSHRQTIRVYKLTRSFPADERFGLTNQLRRSAASVSANIAEGSVASSKKEFLRYLGIAKKSLNEVAHWYILARDIEYITYEVWRDLNNLNHRVGKVIWALHNHLGGS
ncbi:MAG: four helix bundle protein [Gemmatimonadales bacterium]